MSLASRNRLMSLPAVDQDFGTEVELALFPSTQNIAYAAEQATFSA
jgi:hypothetical protein